MFWLFLAILVVGYFFFKANKDQAEKPQNQLSQKRADVSNRESATSTHSRKRTNTARKSSNSKRPYIKCYFDELERIASAEWNNVEVLKDVHHELGFRSRQKAKALRGRISERLSRLETS